MLLDAFVVRAQLLAAHMGDPYGQIPVAIQIFTLYAPFSLVGWLIVGAPVVLLLPVRSITRWPWLLVVTLGACLGPPAMVVILLVLGYGVHPLRRDGLPFFIFSILVSTVSFTVYVALLRNQLRDGN